MQWWYANHLRFSRLSFHRAMDGRRLPLLKTASGPDLWPLPGTRTQGINRNVSRPPRVMTINWHGTVKAASHSDARAQRGLRTMEELLRLGSEEKIASYRPYRCAVNNG